MNCGDKRELHFRYKNLAKREKDNIFAINREKSGFVANIIYRNKGFLRRGFYSLSQ